MSRALEASPNSFILAEIAQRAETGIRMIYRNLEALLRGFPLHIERVERTNCWAFMDTFKFTIPAPFTLLDLLSIYSYKDLARKAIVEPTAVDSIWGHAQLRDLVAGMAPGEK